MSRIGCGLVSARRPRKEIAARVAKLLDMVGLADQAEKNPLQLSGGQQQRVSLARALCRRACVRQSPAAAVAIFFAATLESGEPIAQACGEVEGGAGSSNTRPGRREPWTAMRSTTAAKTCWVWSHANQSASLR